MAKHPSSYMSVGRGGFRRAFRSVLLSKHTVSGVLELAKAELGDQCVYCGISGKQVRLQPDHLWPESQGGTTVPGNVVPACPTCNSDRRNSDWRVFLQTSPRVLSRKPEEIQAQSDAINNYIEEHDQSVAPRLDQVLTAEELDLLQQVELLLSAISDGSLAMAGFVKKNQVTFSDPQGLFRELVEVVRKHRGDSGR